MGNRSGRVGVGAAKGQDVSIAVEKAVLQAKKNMTHIITKDETIPYEVEAKFGSARVLFKPAAVGRGIVAGGAVRTICDLAGVKNISAKILTRSKNKLNIAKAAIKALAKLKSEIEKGPARIGFAEGMAGGKTTSKN